MDTILSNDNWNSNVLISRKKNRKICSSSNRSRHGVQRLWCSHRKCVIESVARWVDGASSDEVSAAGSDFCGPVMALREVWRCCALKAAIYERYTRTHNRNWIRSGNRNQWSLRSSDVMALAASPRKPAERQRSWSTVTCPWDEEKYQQENG